MRDDGPRHLDSSHHTCHECRDRVEITGGWFATFTDYVAHLQRVMTDHRLSDTDRHPSLVAALDQAQAARRESS